MLRDAGDIADRLCIAQLKADRIGTSQVKQEFKEFWEGLFTHLLISPDIDWYKYINELYVCNKNIWDLESDIRKSKIDGNEQEIGRRTIKIREYNKKRVEIKNEINKLTGELFREIKKDHASE